MGEDKGKSPPSEQRPAEPAREPGDSRIELGEVRKGINLAPKVTVNPGDAPPSPLGPAASTEPAAPSAPATSDTGSGGGGDSGGGGGGDSSGE